jgi:hypothetical protein
MKIFQTIKLVIMTVLVISAFASVQVATAEQQIRQKSTVTAQEACEIKGKKLKQGMIVIDRKDQGKLVKKQCDNGKWIQFTAKSDINTFKAKPKGPSEFSCGAGGCNCWGDSDCMKLVDSGKCHGNPITCDPTNPSSCHCD